MAMPVTRPVHGRRPMGPPAAGQKSFRDFCRRLRRAVLGAAHGAVAWQCGQTCEGAASRMEWDAGVAVERR